MNVFAAALVADPARLDEVERAVLAAHRATTPFAGLPHITVRWRRGHVVAFSFSIHADALGIGAYAHADEHALDAFAGVPRLASLAAGRPWARALADERRYDERSLDELGGVHTLLHAEEHLVEVRTSATGSEPALVARRPGLVLVANRATLARLAAWPEAGLVVDSDALLPLCAVGWLAHDRWPASGVEALPPGARLRVRPDGVSIERLAVADPADVAGEGDLPALYDRIADEMVAAAREVAGFGRRPELELTGDVVTRLGAAVYRAAGVDVLAVTPAAANDPDAVVAAEVASLAGFAHEARPVAVAGDELLAALDRQVAHAEGTSNLFDPCPPLALDPRIEVVRHAGGALLGGYDNLASGPRPPVATLDEAQRFIDDVTLNNAALLLRPDALTQQRQVSRRLAEAILDAAGPWSFHELVWQWLREGRGTGANRQAAAYGAVQVAPVLDDRVLRLLAAVPLEHKRSQRAAFELMERLAPELARQRFVGARWRFEVGGPDPALEPASWATREPLEAAPAPPGWRATDGGLLPPALARTLEEPSPAFDEVVDRRKLRELLRAREPLAVRDVRSLYGAVTARHLLEGAWRHRDGARK